MLNQAKYDIFLSYSSRDKEFAQRLYNSLQEAGYKIWSYEWEIRVGESIINGIELGLRDSEYMLLLLSPRAVKSDWVTREWMAKLTEEIEHGRTLILPVLVEKCEIPSILQDKRYVDFTDNYDAGLYTLLSHLEMDTPLIRPRKKSKVDLPIQVYSSSDVEIDRLKKIYREAMMEAIAIDEIRAFEATFSRENWSDTEYEIRKLYRFSEPIMYGISVRKELVEALYSLTTYTRDDMPGNVANAICNLTRNALCMYNLNFATQKPIPEEEVELIEWAARGIGHGVAYDGIKYLRDISVVKPGVDLLWKSLKYFTINGFADSSDGIVKIFDELIGIAQDPWYGEFHNVPFAEAIQLMNFLRLEALGEEGGNLPPFPEGLYTAD